MNRLEEVDLFVELRTVSQATYPGAYLKGGRHCCFRTSLKKSSKTFKQLWDRKVDQVRFNGLLKRKCKKGKRRNYPTKFSRVKLTSTEAWLLTYSTPCR